DEVAQAVPQLSRVLLAKSDNGDLVRVDTEDDGTAGAIGESGRGLQRGALFRGRRPRELALVLQLGALAAGELPLDRRLRINGNVDLDTGESRVFAQGLRPPRVKCPVVQPSCPAFQPQPGVGRESVLQLEFDRSRVFQAAGLPAGHPI